jgi:hypothetical protein
MEIFCQADHSQVIRVEKRNDMYVPVLRPEPRSAATRWSVEYFQGCLEAFADTVPADYVQGYSADLRPLCAQLLRLLVSEPTEAEASLMGSVQFTDDQAGTTSQPFAQPYSIRDFRSVARSGKLPPKTLAWWEQGAWKLTPHATRLCLRVARKIGGIRQAHRGGSSIISR